MTKKSLMFSMLILGSCVLANDHCSAGHAIQFTIANGLGSMNTERTSISSVISPPPGAEVSEYYPPGVYTASSTNSFYGQTIMYDKMTRPLGKMNWSGEFSMAGKIAFGNRMFTRVSAFVGYNGAYSGSPAPVYGSEVRNVETTAGKKAQNTAGTIGNPTPVVWTNVSYNSYITSHQKTEIRGGLGYGFLLGLGKDLSWGSIYAEVGLVARAFKFYFPSATPIQAKASSGGVIPSQGFTGIQGPNPYLIMIPDSNHYGSYYTGYTQAGLRFGGGLAVNLVENVALGISLSAELFGNKKIAINPNICSFTANPGANPAVGSQNGSAVNAKNISNANMMYSNVNLTLKHIITSVMCSLTYSIPVGR